MWREAVIRAAWGLLLIAWSISGANAQVLVDSLNGGSKGKVYGGEFVSGGGWTPVNWNDMITYDTGVFIIRGRLEISVRNFDPLSQNSSPRHHILSMYTDNLGNHNDPTYAASDSTGKSVWNLHTGWNYRGGIKLLSVAGDWIETYRRDLNSWNLDSTYRFIFVWDENRVQFFIDTTLIAENIHRRNFALRYIFIGRDHTRSGDYDTGYPDNEYSAQIGPIYSDLAVFADSVLTPVYPNQLIQYSIFVPKDEPVFSFDADFAYLPFLLDFYSLRKQNNRNLSLAFSTEPGSLKVGGFSPVPIPTDSAATVIYFAPKPDSSYLQVANLRVYHRYFNDIAEPELNLTYVLYPLDSMKTVPVEWLYFDATLMQDRTVLLRWQTATEFENFGFAVERSEDGEVFHEIGFVKGHGTAGKGRSYQFFDRDIKEGEYYYRLKQIDFDGGVNYSPVRKIGVVLPRRFDLSAPYPNPFHGKTRINYWVPKTLQGCWIVFDIYDILGRKIRSIRREKISAGPFTFVWNGKDNEGKNVPSGMYFLVVRLKNGEKITRKLILQR